MKTTLKKYWGYESFRPLQEEIISSILEGRDTLAILPTGGGKSICFQVPALMREGVCIVVSPLIALIKDQVENLCRRGIEAVAIHSGMTYRQIDIALDNVVYGDVKFLYVSPERLRSDLFKARVRKMNVNLIAVDEAHCISQWGYDFRPDYLVIAEILKILPTRIPVVAMTATATETVAEDIMARLEFRAGNVIKGSFLRRNLSYIFRKVEDKTGRLLKICGTISGSGIVYVGRRKSAEDLAQLLQSHGISAEGYHAGMSPAARSAVQERWIGGNTRIIVSTNAFGMGIDKPDVRFVCHYDMPDCVENYFQESGRAGRDGKDSFCILLWNEADLATHRKVIQTSCPSLPYVRDIYQKVFTFIGYAYEEGAGASVKFDVEEFAKRYRLNAATAYYAIKYIESEGYWSLSETVRIPARLQFSVSRDQLYRIQLGDAETDTFVKLLLRMYTGLFSSYVSIDIDKISLAGHYSPEVVKEKLKRLSRMDVVKYIPAISSPMLSLNNERLYDKNLRLPESNWKEKVTRHTERLEAMSSIVSDDRHCRNAGLLQYFGEALDEPCGKCDVCRAANVGKAGSGISEEKAIQYRNLLTLRSK
ncbi:MAG: RecQ family ATP-dependent DNA helicase [Bacteroidales bacterium]|nr:RecQ family ATP-dependent DNA helicase [Candidatus Cacconaster scatequi]